MKSSREQELRAQVDEVRGRLQDLTADLRVVDDEVESLAPQRMEYELLDQACGSLEKLDELRANSLFWGEGVEPAQIWEQLSGVRSRVSAFQAQIEQLDGRRQTILEKIGVEERNLESLGENIYDVREAEARRKLEWIVERDISPVPPRKQFMAWARGGEDDRRFHRSLAASLLVGLLLGVLLPMIPLPLPKRFKPDDEMPRRLAQLVREAAPKPIPPPPVVAEKPPEQTPPEQEEPEPVDEPAEQPEATAVASAEPSEMPGPPGSPEPAAPAAGLPEKKVGKAGILAFRDKFASLAQDKVGPRLGADARYANADDESRASMPTRAMLTTNAPGSSGGINLASLSRNVRGGGGGGGDGDGGGGGGIQGVQVGRATSAIAGIGGGGRPLARGGPGPSRTDEEIQIVFDRYKASFYRLYNRELRNDPTLRGQMVLRLTIEPDGSVSMCVLQSSDMDAPDLAAQVVNRVLTMDFGAKDVEALTIVYPIDFLPAA
ncbi:MAG: AgmX/PglI C-terminal domain-containing protein [Acidobacteriota bacterium]|nr:AgmX/PglI C-terminal domain-containing protein [Acidobacteriota bacterium]